MSHIGQRLWEGSWSSGKITVPNSSKYSFFIIHVTPDINPAGASTSGIFVARNLSNPDMPLRGVGGMTTTTDLRAVGVDIRPDGEEWTLSTIAMSRVTASGLTTYTDRIIKAIDGIY